MVTILSIQFLGTDIGYVSWEVLTLMYNCLLIGIDPTSLILP